MKCEAKYRVVLLEKDGSEISDRPADNLREAKCEAKYMLSDECARWCETSHASLRTYKAEIRSQKNGRDHECVLDFFYANHEPRPRPADQRRDGNCRLKPPVSGKFRYSENHQQPQPKKESQPCSFPVPCWPRCPCADTKASRYALGSIYLTRPAPNGNPAPTRWPSPPMAGGCWPSPGRKRTPPTIPPAPRPTSAAPRCRASTACCPWRPARTWPSSTTKRSPKPILSNVLLEESLPPAADKNGDTPPRMLRAFATDLQSGAVVNEREQEGRFPKFWDVFPRYDASNSVSIDINWQFLADVMRAVDAHAQG